MSGRVLIISRVPGFRRAGVAHVGEHIWPAGTFSAKQIEQLLDEPNLIVRVGPEEEAIMPASNSDGLDGAGSVGGEEAPTKPDIAPEAEDAASGTNSEGQSGSEAEAQTAKPEPIDGARPEGTDAEASLPNPAETGQASAAAPDAAAGSDNDADKPAKKRAKAAKAD